MKAPLWWLQVDHAPLRACELCLSHSRADNGALLCTDLKVCGDLPAVACTAARGHGGGCGPDAARQHWPHIGAVPPAALGMRA